MKSLAGALRVILLGLSVSCASTAPGWSPEPEPNFGFILEFGPCNVDVPETFVGEFTQDRVVEPPITIPPELTDQQMATIYEKMVEIKIDQYPEESKISKPLFGEYVLLSTGYYYSIRIENGDLETSTRWLDNVARPTSEDADRLRDLFQLIVRMVMEHPKYLQLPPAKIGCI